MKIIVISGYSKSGKSTLNSALVKAGIPTASSSEILDIETLLYCNIPVTPYSLSVLVNKQEKDFKSLLKQYNAIPSDLEELFLKVLGSKHTRGITIRDFKIYVAEEVIAPEQGRIFFAKGCLDKLEVSKKKPLGVIFSTIRDERELLYSEILWSSFTTDLIRCNIVSPKQQTGVDSRSLIDLPDIEVTNTLEGADKLLKDFLTQVDNFERDSLNIPF